MEIQAIQTVTPNFGAKLKNNAVTEALLNDMDSRELKQFKSALKKLDKHHEQDVLEIRQDETRGRDNYCLVNTTNEKSVSLDRGFFESVGHSIARGIKEASDRTCAAYYTLFVDKSAQEEKEREEVLSMMV